mgnify:CR=1 FL=1
MKNTNTNNNGKVKNNWRIYLEGRGAGTFRPFLGWALRHMDVHKDRNGKRFIWVRDLIKYKGQDYGTNIHNVRTMKLLSWFSNEVVAFGEVKKFWDSVPDKYFAKRDARKYFRENNFIELFRTSWSTEDCRKLLSRVGLEDWVDSSPNQAIGFETLEEFQEGRNNNVFRAHDIPIVYDLTEEDIVSEKWCKENNASMSYARNCWWTYRRHYWNYVFEL